MPNDKKNPRSGPFDLHERTRSFSLEVIYFFSRLKKDDVNMILGRQLLRAATSIGANYAEADHARSKAEFKSKIGDCLKEAGETKYWLLLFKKYGNKDTNCPWFWTNRSNRKKSSTPFFTHDLPLLSFVI